jgi:hypothetical protein
MAKNQPLPDFPEKYMRANTKDRSSASFRLLIAMMVVMCGVFACQAVAQSAASVSGTVADPSGAVVSGAKVTIRNTDTNVNRTTLTDGAGHYAVPNITPGNYAIIISKNSFATTQEVGIALAVNQVATYNFSLKPGGTLEEVTVQAEDSQVQVASAALGAVIDTKSVVNLPLNGRNFTQMLELTPGVSRVSVAQNAAGGASANPIGSFTFPAVNGQRNRSNMFYVDGANDLGSYNGTYNYQPIIDDIQEFKVLTHSDLAEFGQVTGGFVNVATRGGTNQYHGVLWEYIRNSAFDARPYFATTVNPLRQNQFGGTFGGPVVIPHIYNGHNRTFFFFAYEGFRQSQAAQSLLTTPTPAQLNGDFSNLLARGIVIYNPYSTRPDPAAPGKYLRDAFPGNIIPVNMLNNAALTYAKGVFPAPSATGLPGGQNLIDNTALRTDSDSYTGRIDQSLGQHDLLYGRVSYYNEPYTSPASNPNSIVSSVINGWNTTVREVHTFGPRSVAEAYFGRNVGRNVSELSFPGAPAGFANTLISSGFSSAFLSGFLGPIPTVIPAISIAGYLGSAQKSYQAPNNSDTWEYGGSFTQIVGRHSIKAGVVFATNNFTQPLEWASEQTGISQTGNLEHPTSSTGASTGDALASFLLGAGNQATRKTALNAVHGGWVDGAYAQDQIELTRRLTVNVGVRWDVSIWPIYGASNDPGRYVGNLSLSTGQYELAAVPPACSSTQGAPCIPGGALPANVIVTPRANRALHTTDYQNWQGRFGFAYHPAEKTSILGGYGRFYDEWGDITQIVQNSGGTWPSVTSLQANGLNATTVTALLSDPFNLGTKLTLPSATPFTNSGFYFNQDLKTPYTDEWNVGVEQGFGTSTVMSLTYVGSVGRKLTLSPYSNIATFAAAGTPAQVAQRRPFPYITPTYYNTDGGNSNYQALQASLHKVSSNGLTYLLSYTWSKSIDLGCSGTFNSEDCDIQNVYNLPRSVSGFDLTQIFSASAVYAIPFGAGRQYRSQHWIVNYALGGWSINTIVSLNSGTPYTPTVSGDIANVGGTFVLPNLVGNPTPAHRTPQQWFVASAFQAPPPYSFGDYPRNSLRSDFYHDADLSIFKSFAISHESDLEFRAEAFNFTNSTTFGTPNISYGSPAFGTVSSTATDPRILQFALKLKF